MKRRKRGRGFDCIEFKRQAQAEIYQEIKDLLPEEEIEYFRRAAAVGPLAGWWKALQRRAEAEDGPERSSAETATQQLARR